MSFSGSPYYIVDEVHCCTRHNARLPLSTRAEKKGDSNVTGNIINAMRGFAVMKDHARPTEETSFGKEKQNKTKIAPGLSNSRRIKYVRVYFLPRAMLMLRGTARKTGAFPDLANCYCMGLWSCHSEKAVKSACTVTQAARG